MSHTAAFQFPRPCKFDNTMMDRTSNGVRCPKCGHQVFDPGEEQKCDCEHCKPK